MGEEHIYWGTEAGETLAVDLKNTLTGQKSRNLSVISNISTQSSISSSIPCSPTAIWSPWPDNSTFSTAVKGKDVGEMQELKEAETWLKALPWLMMSIKASAEGMKCDLIVVKLTPKHPEKHRNEVKNSKNDCFLYTNQYTNKDKQQLEALLTINFNVNYISNTDSASFKPVKQSFQWSSNNLIPTN
jgi:hypothetical protein